MSLLSIFKKKSRVPPMELGNLIFGNSRGAFPIIRYEYEEIFCSWLNDNGFDAYGHYGYKKDGSYDPNLSSEHYKIKDNSSYTNDTFVIRAYYWGDEEEIKVLPNFVYFPTNLEISWYKYPLRDAYSNRQFSQEELVEILQKCKESLSL